MLLVEGPWDVAGDRRITGLHAPSRGVVALSAPPETRSVGPVAAAILAGLGKSRMAAPGWERASDEARWARIWLEAFAIRHVVLHRADRLEPDVLRSLDEVVSSAGGRLFAVVDPPQFPRLAERLGIDRGAALGFESLFARIPSAGAQQQALPSPESAPAAGRVRLLRLLAPVDDDDPALLAGFAAAARLPRPDRPTKAELARHLRAILEPVEDPSCFAAAARGVAMAQRPFGWSITLDARAAAFGLPTAAEASPLQIAPLRRFWIFRDPLLGAVWVLVRLPVGLTEILELRMADATDDGAMVAVADEWFDIPSDGAPLIRAQLIERRLEGAGPNDPLLATRSRPVRTEAWLVSLATAAAGEVGVRLFEEELRVRPGVDERWLTERGVSLRWIPRAERVGRPAVDPDAREIADRLRSLSEASVAHRCGCRVAHQIELLNSIPEWPPLPRHVSVPYGTGVRATAYQRPPRRAPSADGR